MQQSHVQNLYVWRSTIFTILHNQFLFLKGPFFKQSFTVKPFRLDAWQETTYSHSPFCEYNFPGKIHSDCQNRRHVYENVTYSSISFGFIGHTIILSFPEYEIFIHRKVERQSRMSDYWGGQFLYRCALSRYDLRLLWCSRWTHREERRNIPC